MATSEASESHKIFRTLFDEHRILWDILRYHSYFVTKQAVKQFIPPQSFVARNYVSDDDSCKIRMSRLHVMPWLSLFVSPDNAVMYSENDPIVPAENIKWSVRQIDNSRLDTTDNYDPMQANLPHETDGSDYDSAISFIPSRDISIPIDNRTLNFNPNAPSDININATGLVPSDAICNPQLELEIGLSSRNDFRQSNTDNDIHRFERIDFNQTNSNSAHWQLLRDLQTKDLRCQPHYGRLDDSWSKYLATIDQMDQSDMADNDEPEEKRSRSEPEMVSIYQPPPNEPSNFDSSIE